MVIRKYVPNALANALGESDRQNGLLGSVAKF